MRKRYSGSATPSPRPPLFLRKRQLESIGSPWSSVPTSKLNQLGSEPGLPRSVRLDKVKNALVKMEGKEHGKSQMDELDEEYPRLVEGLQLGQFKPNQRRVAVCVDAPI